MKKVRNSKGFTLIELMIVVVIIGILAALAIPRFTGVSRGAKQAEAEPILKQICTLQEAYYQREGVYAATVATTPGWETPNAKWFSTFTWNAPAAGAWGTVTATPIAGQNLQPPTMNCQTRVLTLGAAVP